MKKVLVLILAICMMFTVVACNDDVDPPKLATPANVAISDTGLITWDAVEHAEQYVVVINDKQNVATTNSYQVASVADTFTYSVIAKAKGYTDSNASAALTFEGKGTPEPDKVTLIVSGNDEIKSGKTEKLTATVSGSDDKTVNWTIVEGNDFASVDANGNVTAEEVTENTEIKVKATSNADNTVSVVKTLTILAKPVLTGEMLETLQTEKISFDGYIKIDLYTMGIIRKLYTSSTSTVSTAMDGTYWYANYYNGTTSTYMSLYYKNNNNIANQIFLSFMNDEEYVPMVDDNNREVSWDDAGLYNNFKGLAVSDFSFNEDTWQYEYAGEDSDLIDRMIASANPYTFVPTNLGLTIEGDEIMGITSVSKPDYGIATNYEAIMTLNAAINYGESVEVPKITKYQHDSKHDALGTALDNMHNLDTYKVTYTEMVATYMTSGYTTSGFVETITDDLCYFEPYNVKYDKDNNVIKDFTNEIYGYKKIDDNLYNAYSKTKTGYAATRAYNDDFSAAKPSFAFAPEIFTSYSENEDEGTITYYSDSVMTSVASTFYYGLGNDVALYGLFATTGQLNNSTFTPFVVVKDGYITEAAFYFYLGQIYGVVTLEYSDFDTATIPADANIEFATREVPSAWDELIITESEEGSSTKEDKEVNALEFLKTFFEDENIGGKMPFFGAVLGDTYGFGLSSRKTSGGSSILEQCITFYYDVPLDLNYTIDSYIRKLEVYLESQGFAKNKYGEYVKGDIKVQVVDANLDLTIYVWKVTPRTSEK